MLLFLLSVGLTLIFGMLDVINLAHGSFYTLGADAGLAMTAGLGVNVHRVFTGVFAVGAALAAVAGVIAVPIQAAYPGMGVEILVRTLIVVVIGGLGSLKGSLAGSLILGQAETFGKAWFPDTSMFIIYGVMVLVLLARPTGLFGRELR